MNRVISGEVLKGIAEALKIHAPHLLPKIHGLISSGLVDGPEGTRGSSTHGQLTATIPWDEGEPILRALEAIESDHGSQALFADRQINLLVVRWRTFAEPRQLP